MQGAGRRLRGRTPRGAVYPSGVRIWGLESGFKGSGAPLGLRVQVHLEVEVQQQLFN